MAKEHPDSKHIWIGPKPPTPDLSWWYLTREARQLLLEQRLLGRFGRVVGQAAYWHVQEVGEVEAHVEALHYISDSVSFWWSAPCYRRLKAYLRS